MHPYAAGIDSFIYPLGGLLQVEGLVSEREIRQPQQRDSDGEECIIVLQANRLRS